MRFKKTWLLLIAIPIAGFAATVPFIEKPPPDRIVVATGPEGGGYDASGRWLQQELADSEIRVELRSTAGSIANLQLLREDTVDLAFIQGGVIEDESGLAGIASLYYEPIWIFARQPVRRLADLRGRRIQVGEPGSGTRSVAVAMLGADGVLASNADFLEEPPEQAADAIVAGRTDALFLVSSPRAAIVSRLLAAPGVGIISLSRARAYERRFGYLQHLTLSPGMVDLEQELPHSSVEIVATTAGIVARDDLHPAIPPLLIAALEKRYGRRSLFEDRGEFPSPEYLDAPIGRAARHYYKNGRSFLYRILPFRLAALIDRLKILLLPAITLLFPLIRFAPPIYRWRIRRRIFLWYRVIVSIERRLRAQDNDYELTDARRDLDRLQREITGIDVPLSYAEELYNLRLHVRHVREQIERDGSS